MYDIKEVKMYSERSENLVLALILLENIKINDPDGYETMLNEARKDEKFQAAVCETFDCAMNLKDKNGK